MAINQTKSQNGSSEGRSRGGQNSPSNFKHDPQRAAEAGRKGGEARRNSSNLNDEIGRLDQDRRQNEGNR